MLIRFTLSEEDHAKYGGDASVTLDTDQLADLDYDRLAELERDIRRDDTSIAKILAMEWPEMSALGIRGMIWLARQLAGIEKPFWPGFKPKAMKASFEIVQRGGDANPPAGGSSEPPSAKAKPSKKA